MYVEAYELIHEILEDEELQAYVKDSTGKRLAVIDSGPRVTAPAASIAFMGGSISRGENAMQDAEYDVTFAMPYWGADGMKKCHGLLDVAIEAFFAHEQREGGGARRRNFIKTVNPLMMEEDPEAKWWVVTLRVTATIFRA